MPRPLKDPLLRSAMCRRLSAALDESQMTDTHLSELLGYATSATLSAMRRGKIFLDAEKLAILGEMCFHGVAHLNLHWVLTGNGPAFFAETTNKADQHFVAALCELVGRSVTKKMHSPTEDIHYCRREFSYLVGLPRVARPKTSRPTTCTTLALPPYP